MKRVVCLLVFVLVLNGCDDGNLTVENIDFSKATTQSCSTNNIIYKLKEKEALLLEIPKSNFVNEPTLEGNPTLINIDNAVIRVVYNFYNGTIAADNICNTIPPPLPTITKRLIALSGAIQIITTAIKSTNTTENSTKITGYNHNITLKNISWDSQKNETIAFGDYITSSNTLPFGFDKVVEQCPTSKQIYNYTPSEALTIDAIDPALIVNSVTPIGAPRTGLISATNNKVTYRLYSNGVLSPEYFCITTVPVFPTISEEWKAVNGVVGVSGIIEVTTTTNGSSGFKHTIVLKNVTLKKGNSDFRLGDNYIYGDLLTN